MKLSNIRIALIYILYVLEAGIIYTQTKGMDDLTSILFFGTFALTFLLFGSLFTYGVKKTDLLLYVIIIAAGVNVIWGLWLNGGALTLTYLKKYIMFCSTLIYVRVVTLIQPTQRLKNWILNVNAAIAIMLVWTYNQGGRLLYDINGIRSGYLTFGFTNPNLTAIFCLCIAFLEVAAFKVVKRKGFKVFHFILFLYMSYFTLLTQSRNCILVLAVGVAMLVINFFVNDRLMSSKQIIMFVVIWPLLFVAIYYFVLGNEWILDKMGFLDLGEGKGLSSRVDIWTPAINAFKQNPIMGAYYEISNGTGESQMHNSHLDILVSYGSIVCGATLYYLYKSFLVVRAKAADNKNKVFILGAMMVLMLGMGEAAIFSGGLGIFLYLGAFLLLAKIGV